MSELRITIPIRTENPLNGSQGWTRGSGIAKAKLRKEQRDIVHLYLSAIKRQTTAMIVSLYPVSLHFIRYSPGPGFDPHDGLPASFKAICDQTCDELGLKSDRSHRIALITYSQVKTKRSEPDKYRIEIVISRAKPASEVA